MAAVNGSAGGMPAGYEVERERGVEIVALPSVMGVVRDAIGEAGTLYAWAARSGSRSFVGRGAVFAVATPAREWVVRHYRRGGAVARVLGDRYVRISEPRALRELRASVLARSRGVATPEVVAAVVYPAGSAVPCGPGHTVHRGQRRPGGGGAGSGARRCGGACRGVAGGGRPAASRVRSGCRARGPEPAQYPDPAHGGRGYGAAARPGPGRGARSCSERRGATVDAETTAPLAAEAGVSGGRMRCGRRAGGVRRGLDDAIVTTGSDA
jgi:hypothetical protein